MNSLDDAFGTVSAAACCDRIQNLSASCKLGLGKASQRYSDADGGEPRVYNACSFLFTKHMTKTSIL